MEQRLVPGSWVKISPFMSDEYVNKDVLVRDARTKQRVFLPGGLNALVIGVLDDMTVFIFVSGGGFYRTTAAWLKVVHGPK